MNEKPDHDPIFDQMYQEMLDEDIERERQREVQQAVETIKPVHIPKSQRPKARHRSIDE